MPKIKDKKTGEVTHFPYTDAGMAAADKAKKAAKKGKKGRRK